MTRPAETVRQYHEAKRLLPGHPDSRRGRMVGMTATGARRARSAARTKEIQAQAEHVQFGRMVATMFTALFVAAGWVVGTVWYGIRYCASAVRYGYRQGARIPRAQETDKL